MMERIEHLLDIKFDDLDLMRVFALNAVDVENAMQKYSSYLEHTVTAPIYGDCPQIIDLYRFIDKMFDTICKSWAVPNCQLGYALCTTLRNSGGLDLLVDNCMSRDRTLQSSSARLLEQCLTTENRKYILEKRVEKLLRIVCEHKNQISSVDKLYDSTGFLQNLIKRSEIMCSDVIKLGGLDVFLHEFRDQDTKKLKRWASGLANLSPYGGPECQDRMTKSKVHTWLFALAFNTNDHLKYDALLAIVVLVTNKEDEVAAIKSKSIDLINPSVFKSTELVKFNTASSRSRGHIQKWLKRLVLVLSSRPEEARNLFGFDILEAGIKKQLRLTSVFRVVDVIESLNKLTSAENPIAPKLEAKTLMLTGEEVPRQHNQEEVPLWSVSEVHKWVKRIDFSEFAEKFLDNLVDGHILLDITEDNLLFDIGMKSGIMRKRFMRELDNLKETADYSSIDSTGLQSFLNSISPKYVIYTYPMLNAGVNMNTIRNLTDNQLEDECRITNSIHKSCISQSIREIKLMESSLDKKKTDVFISYRRSNGSELASLIKVNLEIRGYRVFIDVVKLENGHFGNNLIKHIKLAKNFVLVLTKSSLDRCVDDNECNDWVHKEIATAMENHLNIIPIVVDDFTWPEILPGDIGSLQTYDVVQWSNDHDDPCIDAIVKAMHGDLNAVQDGTRDDLCQNCLP